MDLQLAGKRALVTGSSSGIGAAVARELAAEGVAVVVHGRDRAKAEAVAAEIGAAGVALGDVSTDEGQAVGEAALAALGGVDILVNCAGGVVRSDNPDFFDVSPEEWEQSYRLNLFSAVRLSQRLTPAMMDRGWGRVINVSSVGGTQLSGRLLEYGSAKAALDHFTANLSRRLAPHGVTVNAVIPGTILTPQAERWIATLGQQHDWPADFAERERIYTRDFVGQPVPRLGRAEEIAAAVAFLASPRSDFTTGALLQVDGGSTRAI